jgi:hypothetical protein
MILIIMTLSKKLRRGVYHEDNTPKQYTADIKVELKNHERKRIPIKALYDTRTNSVIILRYPVQKGKANTSTKKCTKVKTLGGSFITRYESVLECIKFPELGQDKVVTRQAHVDDKTNKKEASYDVIIWMDLLCFIGLTVDTDNKYLCWDGHELPHKEKALIFYQELLTILYHMSVEPSIIKEAEGRQSHIFDADYNMVEVDHYVQEMQHP